MADPIAAAAAAAAAGGAAAGEGLQAALLPVNNQQGHRMFPLNRAAFVGFLSKVADAAVMGLLTLNIFSATFLLAWGDAGSVCLPKPDEKKSHSNDDHFTLPSWVKVMVIGIPFTMYPITVYVSGLVKAAEQGRHTLGLVASLCLGEFVYGLLIGGLMTVCMSEAPWEAVLGVTITLNVLLFALRGYFFEYPAWLSYFMSCPWFHRQAAPAHQDAAAANNNNNNDDDVDNNNNNNHQPPPQPAHMENPAAMV